LPRKEVFMPGIKKLAMAVVLMAAACSHDKGSSKVSQTTPTGPDQTAISQPGAAQPGMENQQPGMATQQPGMETQQPGAAQPQQPGVATQTPSSPSLSPSQTSPSSPSTLSPSSPSTSSPSSSIPSSEKQPVAGMTSDALVQGLVSLSSKQGTAAANNIIVDVSDVLSDDQVTQLMSSLNSNPDAKKAADDLTHQLQGKGILKSGERIVGYSSGKLYKTSK
jgi:hypothetical protein